MAKPPKEDKKAEPGPRPSEGQLPLLLQVSLSLSRLALLAAAAAVAIASLAAGADLMSTILRTGVAVVGAGAFLWALNWCLARAVLQAVQAQLHELEQSAAGDRAAHWEA